MVPGLRQVTHALLVTTLGTQLPSLIHHKDPFWDESEDEELAQDPTAGNVGRRASVDLLLFLLPCC